MHLSIAGLLICCALYLGARLSQSPLVVALITSFAFGSTAIVSIYALGGSSPLIYAIFAAAVLCSVAMHRDFFRELGTVLLQQPAAWLLIALALYAVIGAVLLPRLFEAQTTVFVAHRSGTGAGGIVETLLAPTIGNITQTLYFLLGILSVLAFSVLLLQRRMFTAVRQGYFAWAVLHISMGYIDLFGKMAGLGDVLSPIRSAAYAMLTDVGVAGFRRIAGAYSEASAFGSVSVMLLAFTFTFWRCTHSMFAAALSVALAILMVLSTSSTAYVTGGLLLIFFMGSLVVSALSDRLRAQDLLLLVGASACLAVTIGLVLNDNTILDPLERLFDEMVINKASSASGQERFYWNYRSLQSLYETAGLGIGLGSSRASSWVIAVVSQLGIVGTFIFGYLVLEVMRSGRLYQSNDVDPEVRAVILSVRAATLGGLLSASVAGGGADPGLPVFVGIAITLSYRKFVRSGLASPTRPGFALSGARTRLQQEPDLGSKTAPQRFHR